MSPYVRTVKTASGATAVQIVYSSHRGSRDIDHIGSAHGEAELEGRGTAAARGRARRAFDISPEMVRLARARTAGKVNILVADLATGMSLASFAGHVGAVAGWRESSPWHA